MINHKKLFICTAITATSALSHAATINNPGFESGFSSWNETEPAAISSDAYSGSKSLKIQGSPARVYQLVNIQPNTEYTLSAYVLGKGQIGVNDLNGLFKNKTFDVSSWTKVTKTFTSANTNSLQVFAKHYNSSSDVRFDNFTLVEGSNNGGGTDDGAGSGDGTTIPSLSLIHI